PVSNGNGIVIHVLNSLIETCKDREYGYRTAAEAVSNDQLKTLFRNYEQQSAEFAAELQNEVQRLGGDPEQRGSLAGWFMRGWMSVKSAIRGDDTAILAECQKSEESARKNYENALREV